MRLEHFKEDGFDYYTCKLQFVCDGVLVTKAAIFTDSEIVAAIDRAAPKDKPKSKGVTANGKKDRKSNSGGK